MKNLQIAFPEKQPDGREVLRYRIFNQYGNSRYVDGNPAVEQLVAKLLLTDPNTDFLDPSSGAGLRQIIGRETSPQALAVRRAEISLAVIRVQDQVLTSQVDQELPAAERLQTIEIETLDYDADQGLWTLDLALTMEDGNVGRVLLGAT